METKKCNFEDSDYLNRTAVEVGSIISVAAKHLIYGEPIHEQQRAGIENIANK